MHRRRRGCSRPSSTSRWCSSPTPTPAATGCSNRCASSAEASCATRNGLPSPTVTRSWYLDLAERSARSLGGPDEPAAASRLDREFGNLRSTFWSFAERGAVEQCARLVVALREYSFRSMRAEVIAWADDVITMPGVRRLAARAAGARHRGVRSVRPWRPRPARSSTASERWRRRSVSGSARQGSPSGHSATRGSTAAMPTSPSSGWTGCSTTPAPAPPPG